MDILTINFQIEELEKDIIFPYGFLMTLNGSRIVFVSLDNKMYYVLWDKSGSIQTGKISHFKDTYQSNLNPNTFTKYITIPDIEANKFFHKTG